MPDFNINVVIKPKTKSGTRVVEKDLNRIDKSAKRTQGNITRLIGGVALLAAAFKAARTIAQFEQTMSTVAAVTNATSVEFELLTNRAKELGISTRFSATQAAQGLVELARAGLSTNEALLSIGDTLVLAQAGELSLAEAAGITTTALKVFNLEADQTARVADDLIISANNSKTNVTQMGQAFTFAAVNAADLGLSVETAAAALGVLAEGGLVGSRAGTAFRAVLLGLASPTEEAQLALEGAELELKDVDIAVRGLLPVLQTLAEAELDVGEKATIFGKRFGSAASILTKNLGKFEEIIGLMGTMGGEAQRVADVMDDNLNGSLLRMRSAFEGLILEIGAGGASGGLQAVLGLITKALRFLAENIDTVIKSVEFLILVLGTRFAIRMVPKVIVALAKLRLAIITTFVTNPVGLFITAVGVAVAALVTLGRDLKLAAGEATTFGDFLVAAGETGKAAFEQFVDFLQETFRPIFQSLGIDADVGIKDMLKIVAFGLDAIAGLFRATFTSIAVLFDFRVLGEALLSGVFEATNAFIRAIETAFDSLRATISGVLKTIGAAASATVDLLAAVGQASLAKVNPFQEKDTADILFERVKTLKDAIDLSGDTFAKNINAELRKLEAVDTFTELVNPFAGAGADLGNAMAQAWTEAFKAQAEKGAQTTLQGIFDRADEIAAERERAAEERRREQAAALAGAGDAPTGTERVQVIDDETAAAERRNVTLEQYRQGIMDEIGLLNLSARAREVAAELLALENELRGEGLKLTETQQEAILAELELLQARQLQAEILDEIRGPTEALVAGQEAINQLFKDGRITVDEYNKALRDLADSTGIESLQDQLLGFTTFAEQTLGRVLGGLEDAFVELATTGEVSFSKLVDSMLQDIARLLVQQGLKIFLNILSGGTGSTVGAVIGAIGGGAEPRQAGGPTTPDTPFLVGEQGPEIFVPETAGRVLSRDDSMAAVGGTAAAPVVVPAPQVNVAVVNVSDPNEVTDAIGSNEGERAIVNVVRRRRREINNALG